MSEEVMELREEIDVLKERINILEKQERNRKTLNYVKFGIRLILFLAAIYGALKGYEYFDILWKTRNTDYNSLLLFKSLKYLIFI